MKAERKRREKKRSWKRSTNAYSFDNVLNLWCDADSTYLAIHQPHYKKKEEKEKGHRKGQHTLTVL